MVTQLTPRGRAPTSTAPAGRDEVLDFGAHEFLDLEEKDAVESVGDVDVAFEVIGGDVQKRSAGISKAGGVLVSVVGPVEARPAGGLAVDFVVEADRFQLVEIAQRVRTEDCERTSELSPHSTRPSQP